MNRLLRQIIRRYDRIRGTGWLDCPSCHEHAVQDVVDEMTFLCLTFYRFTPVLRRRVLVCRRCQHRRRAGRDEMACLNAAGGRVRRAWLVPIGLSPVVGALLVVLVVSSHRSSADSGLIYTKQDARPVANVTFQLPLTYNHSTDVDSCPNVYTATDPAGTLVVHLRRILDRSSPADLLAAHLQDDAALLQDNGFPDTVPSGVRDVTVGGVKAKEVTFDYLHANDKAEIRLLAFSHGGVGYTLTFQALGDKIIREYPDIADRVTDSVSFEGREASPADSGCPVVTPSPSPGSSSSSSSSSSGASPSPSPSATP